MKEQMVIAAEIAVEAHANQMYGSHPYFYHLKCVDDLVIAMYAPKGLGPSQPYSSHNGSEIDILRAVAFLHDVLEDTDITVTDLAEAGICEQVIEAVVAITKYEDLQYEDYIKGVLDNPYALKVKTCDTATNLAHSLMAGNTKRIDKYNRQFKLLIGLETFDENS